MFVRFISADRWIDRADTGESSIDPSWDAVEQAIRRLDGRQKTIVVMSESEGADHYMIVCGRWKDRFMVNATTNNVDFFSVVDPKGSQEKVSLYVGGQDGEYEERKCVPLQWALEAARHFYETGELVSTLNWSSDY